MFQRNRFFKPSIAQKGIWVPAQSFVWQLINSPSKYLSQKRQTFLPVRWKIVDLRFSCDHCVYTEQFTYNVLCQLLPYNDITALLSHMNCFSSASSNCFRKKKSYFHTWLASLRCFYYVVFSTVEHKKKTITVF